MIRIGCSLVMSSVAVLLACAAWAQDPVPAKCSMINLDPAGIGKNGYIVVAGVNSQGLPDPCTEGRCGEYRVVLIDADDKPVVGMPVCMDFSGCWDIQISCDQLESLTGQTNVYSKTVCGTSGSDGSFTFKVQGASNSMSTTAPPTLSPGTEAGTSCATVFALGGGGRIDLGNLVVSAYDVNGLHSTENSAVNAADVAKVKTEALLSDRGMKARADYNYDNKVNAADAGLAARFALTPSTMGTVKTTLQINGGYCP